MEFIFLTFLFQFCDHNFFSVPSFGGGPAVNHLYVCAICQVEIEALAKRRKTEIDTFIKVGDDVHEELHLVAFRLRYTDWAASSSGLQLNKEFQAEEAPTVILCISMQWFREWESFVKGKDNGRKPYKASFNKKK